MQEFYGGDDPDTNPIEVAHLWLDCARKRREVEVDAVHLASVDEMGLPNLRVVYVREIDAHGFIFYTNYEGQKGKELRAGKAAINYYFPNWGRQIRVRGLVEKVSAEKSDEYFLGRAEGSRLGAWMSQQSRLVSSREQMEKELAAVEASKANKRPDYWGGFRLLPLQMEFWAMGDYRIHDRFSWQREKVSDKWNMSRLYP